MCSGLLESNFHRERMHDILFDTQRKFNLIKCVVDKGKL